MSATDPATAILVACPVPEEAAGILRRLEARRRLGPRLAAGRLGGRDVAVAVVGDGRSHAEAGLGAALVRTRPERVLVLGVAGALDPVLALGDLVVAEHVVGPAGEPVPAPWSPPLMGARRGTVVSSPRLAATPEEKAALRRRHGPLALTVDIESAALATVAAKAGLPWAAIRLVSDRADDALPRWLAALQDEEGHLERGRILRSTLLNPRRMRTLLRMGRWMRGASDRLAEVVVEVV